MRIPIGGIVLDDKRQTLYIFETCHSGRWKQIEILIVNLIEKTFRKESSKMLSTDEPMMNNPISVMVGDVIYIYHTDKCRQWNIVTNQVDEISGPDADVWELSGAVYCDMPLRISRHFDRSTMQIVQST